MKHLLLTTALVTATATGAFAQSAETNANADAAASGTVMSGDMFRAESTPSELRASDFLGMRVFAAAEGATEDAYAGAQDNWEDVGEINDVILNRDGEVQAVLVDIGGFLGIGERQVAVNMDSLDFVSDSSTGEDETDFFLVLTADRAALEGAPAYGAAADAQMEETAAATDQAMDNAEAEVEETADAAGEEMKEAGEAVEQTAENAAQETGEAMEETADAADNAADAAGEKMEQAADATAAAAASAGEEIKETAEAAGEKIEETADAAGEQMEAAGDAMTNTDTAATTSTEAEANADATATAAADADATTEPGAMSDFSKEGYAAAAPDYLTTENLTGARVYDTNDKWVGEISELVVDDQGKITDAIVDVGGFLGIGEKPVALQLSDLQVMQQQDGEEVRIYTAMAEDELKAMPEFEKE
ncbi:PRC-barrel domain-containing protein [Pseudooceanicola sp. LIPI14-2-Ac024]|uniref:PRC-barrel domain-containing protein n=1 Tax=Pseudooceanicola sp. LIPI14-2-Ac024 TaxID=3344875 RepID=UPI0035CECFA3